MEDFSSMILKAKRKAIEGEKLKMLTPKKTLQRLPIAFAQVKGNNLENLLNEIRQIVYSFYQSKEIIKKAYKLYLRTLKIVNLLNLIFRYFGLLIN